MLRLRAGLRKQVRRPTVKKQDLFVLFAAFGNAYQAANSNFSLTIHNR
jgi:hypothetical protein